MDTRNTTASLTNLTRRPHETQVLYNAEYNCFRVIFMIEDTPTPDSSVEISALKAMEHEVSRTLVKIETDAGLVGYGEAGADGPTVRAQLDLLKDGLIGADPTHIERHFDRMTTRQHGFRPHVPTVSGVDIALWDLTGKIYQKPISKLLLGRHRNSIPFYINTAPKDPTDLENCRQWASGLLNEPDTPSAVKLTFDEILTEKSPQREGISGRDKQTLHKWELAQIREAADNIRDALGSKVDFIAHCHNEWDLPSALGLAEAVAPASPLWLEDPLPVPYTDNWATLKRDSPCRILTGEKLELAREFQPFLTNSAVDLLQPDLAFAGGITGCRKIADLADLHYVPLTAHNTGGLILNAATVHFGASVRNFWMTETQLTQQDLIRGMGNRSGLTVTDGMIEVPDSPGLGIDVNENNLKEYRVEGEPYWD